MLTVGSLFSGIGGLDLGLERAGMQTRWMCEIDPFCRNVLRHHWPDVPVYEDVRDVDASAEHVDLICGGFPCQPVSLAGKRLAQADPRWLWPEFSRIVGELRPRYVLVENVPGLASKGLRDVLADLAAFGYDAEWEVVSAASVGAPHIRERLFVVAYPGSERRQQVAGGPCPHEAADGWRPQEDHELAGHGEGHRPGQVPRDVADPNDLGRDWRPRVFWTSRGTEPAYRGPTAWQAWATEPDVGRVAHGIPRRVDQLRAYGNAVVPQVAEFVGNRILAHYVATQAMTPKLAT